MSNRILASSKIIPAHETLEFERWNPTQLSATGENTRIKPRTLKDLTESMLDKIVEAALQDAPLNQLQTLSPPETPPDPLSLIPPEILETAKQQAYQEGYAQGLAEGKLHGHEQGYAEGYQSGVETITEEIERIKQLAQNTSSAFEQFEETLAPQLLQLSVSISEQILRREIQTPSESIIRVIRSAFDEMIGTEELKRLHINPKDIDIVMHHLGDELNLGAWVIVPDENVVMGGCLINTRQATIDAQVETCWHRVMTSLGTEHPLRFENQEDTATESASANKKSRRINNVTGSSQDNEPLSS